MYLGDRLKTKRDIKIQREMNKNEHCFPCHSLLAQPQRVGIPYNTGLGEIAYPEGTQSSDHHRKKSRASAT